MRQNKFSRGSVYVSVLTALCLIGGTCFNVTAKAEVQKPDISSPAAILMDAKSGKVLYEKNSKQR